MKINIFWFRRDLRLEDNTALNHALNSGLPVLPLFIFDTNITDELPADDPRVNFIYETLWSLNRKLNKIKCSILVRKGEPQKIWKELTETFSISAVYINKDYEPYSSDRDAEVESLLKVSGISFFRFKDQVIFEENEIIKSDGKPYTVFTPYKKRWMQSFRIKNPGHPSVTDQASDNYLLSEYDFPSPESLGYRKNDIKVQPYNLDVISEYHKYRDLPGEDRTSYLSPHLRFGTVSIRNIAEKASDENPVFLNELIWREFFKQILFHFPKVVTDNFKKAYDDIRWKNDEKDFEKWCRGETGYPLVDAGMRQLNRTGYMHNRVRMICAGFLCKHLLTDWRWGEAYFAQKLLDYELSSNNGNWQWAAGTGCDAAPYFRVFNPEIQQKKFDPANEYIKRWVEDFGKPSYPEKIVDHDFARKRAVETYRSGIRK